MGISFWRSGVLVAMLFVATGFGGTVHAAADAAPDNAEFGRMLKSLADSGRLHEIAYVNSVLGLRFKVDEAFAPETYPCPGGGGNYQRTAVRYLADKQGWYRAMPGAKTMLFANSGEELRERLIKKDLNEPVASLVVHRSTPCVAGDPESIDAELDFGEIQSFGCFDKRDAGEMVEGMEHGIWTDGASGMRYEGWRSEYAGSALTFEYGTGTACAYGIRLSQELQFGFLELRTKQAFDHCMAEARRSFCTMPADDRRQGMNDYELAQCHGSFDGFMQHQPRTGKPPEPESQRWEPIDLTKAAVDAEKATADAAEAASLAAMMAADAAAGPSAPNRELEERFCRATYGSD